MTADAVLLVAAKAPVPGLAKTRLTPPATPEQAACIAAASLLDTVDAVLDTPGAEPVLAFTGQLDAAQRAAELRSSLRRMTLISQQGKDFGSRLARAHADTAHRFPGRPVLQIGMDTPQLTPALLAGSLATLSTVDAVLGRATDGGWWALGLRDPRHAEILRAVPMSRGDTGARTLSALLELGLRVALLPDLSDVDTMSDAVEVAAALPGSRFATAVRAVGRLAAVRRIPGARRPTTARERDDRAVSP